MRVPGEGAPGGGGGLQGQTHVRPRRLPPLRLCGDEVFRRPGCGQALVVPADAPRPLVLLDVDGVLNGLPPPGRPVPWQDWRTGYARSRVGTFRIGWSPTVVAAVRGWRELADVQWLTTWGHEANDSLRELLEMPELPVAGSPDDPPEGRPDPAGEGAVPEDAVGDGGVGDGADGGGAPSERAADGGPDRSGAPAAHAAVAPAAPDRLTGRWWKFDVVRRLVRADPQRPLVWIDDDLAGQRDVQDWVRTSATCLLVAPHPASGLTEDDLRAVEDFLRRPS